MAYTITVTVISEDEWASAMFLMEQDPSILDITIRENAHERLELMRVEGFGIVRMHTIY